MKRWARKYLTPFIIGSSILFGCEEEPLEVNIIDKDISEETIILTDVDLNKINSINENSITFSEAMKYSSGDILVGGINEKTPNGLLKKIKSTTNNKTFVLEKATLEEVINNGTINFNKNLSVNNLENKNSFKSNKSGYNFEIPINEILYDIDGDYNTTDDQAKIFGGFYFNATTNFNVEFEKGLKEASFSSSISGVLDLKLDCDLHKEFKKNIPIGELSFSPILVPGAPVPIVIKPKIEIDLNFSGDTNGELDVNFNGFSELSPRVSYTSDGGYKFFIGKDYEFSFDTPNFFFSGEAKASIDPTLNIIINGVIGPSIGTNHYLRAKIDTESNPWWELYSGLNVNVGANFGVLSKFISPINKNILQLEELVLQSEGSKLEANLELYPNVAYVNDEIIFDGSKSSGDIIEYFFDFNNGDYWIEREGDSGFDGIVKYNYPKSGTYSPIIKVKDRQGYRDEISTSAIINDIQEEDTFTDIRDGQIYDIVKIGNQTWFQENLNYNSPNSCYYNNDSLTNHEYGRLYTWNDAKNYCPEGWHLPTKEEWCELARYYESNYDCSINIGYAGENIGIILRNEDFSATFSGYGIVNNFWDIDQSNYLWTSSPGPEGGHFRAIIKDEGHIFHNYIDDYLKMSVRPIKD